MTPDLFRTLVGQAALSPSVHNVQPARWRQEGAAALLLEDRSVHLSAADPRGEDAAKSLGAACEGMCLAAAARGLNAEVSRLPPGDGPLRPWARLTFQPADSADPLAAVLEARQSWRGTFAPVTPADRTAALALAADDVSVLADPRILTDVARLCDAASHGFLRQRPFRAELLSWMRLSPRHPRWATDGLNAEAMRLGWLERHAAGLVMGPGFALLDRLGIAAPLLAEGAKTAKAVALLVLHRPPEADAFDHGRALHRAWLRIEAAGFGAAVLAALADDPAAAQSLRQTAGLGPDRRIVTAFRIGRRPPHAAFARARLPVDAVIV